MTSYYGLEEYVQLQSPDFKLLVPNNLQDSVQFQKCVEEKRGKFSLPGRGFYPPAFSAEKEDGEEKKS